VVDPSRTLLTASPNTTTFIVPGECFPTRYRSTSHGLSAAAGKIGSIVAQAAIAPLRTRGASPGHPNPWLGHVMQIFAFFMLLGCFSTLLIPETRRVTLERLAGEFDLGEEGGSQKGGGEERGAETVEAKEPCSRDQLDGATASLGAGRA
jgi:hypothetical protein